MSNVNPSDLPRSRPPAGKGVLRALVPNIPGSAKPDGMDLREAFGIFRRRINLLLGTVVIITTLATVGVFQLVPRYTAEATVMLDTRRNQVVDIQNVLSGLQGDAIVIRSEVEILLSPALARKVSDKLELYNLPEFNPALAAPPGPLDHVRHPFAWIGDQLRQLLTPNSDKPATTVEPPDAKSTAARLLLGRVQVINDGRSLLLRIRAESEDRGLAAKIANTYADTYLLDQLEAKFDAVRRATGWLNEHLSELKDKVRDSDRAVQAFKEQHNLTEIRGGTVTAQQLAELNSQLIIAAGERGQKEADLRQLQDQVRAGHVDASSVMASPLVQKLRERQAELLQQQAQLSTRYKPGHPTMVNLRAEIEDVGRKLQEETDKTVRGLSGEVSSARAREAALRESLAGLQKGTAAQDKLQVQLRELTGEADANRALYDSFLQKFKQTSAQEDIQQADARMVTTAQPPLVPSFPNKTMFVGFALVLSLFVGLGLAFLIERLDNGFRTSDQVEKIIGMPTLGLVPTVLRREIPQNLVVERPTVQYSEAIRSIRTALRYSDIDHPPKVILITSSLPGEGKTVFATSFARSVARSGARALLIDCDLRRPGIARLLKCKAEPGLVGLFAEDCNPADLICLDEGSGMHFIPSSGGTANPQDLLGSQHMRSFLDRMRSQYDLIIVDAPPVLAVSDPIILSHIVDTTLYLVRWEKTPRPVVAGAMKILRSNGGPVAGVVLSRVNARKHALYGYGDAGYYYGRYGGYYNKG
jgi:capsular exopolysaccharide synthesis family protein